MRYAIRLGLLLLALSLALGTQAFAGDQPPPSISGAGIISGTLPQIHYGPNPYVSGGGIVMPPPTIIPDAGPHYATGGRVISTPLTPSTSTEHYAVGGSIANTPSQPVYAPWSQPKSKVAPVDTAGTTGQIAVDTIRGLPGNAKDVVVGVAQGLVGAGANTSPQDYKSAIQRGDGQAAGQVIGNTVAVIAPWIVPEVGVAARVGTASQLAKSAEIVQEAQSAAKGGTYVLYNEEGQVMRSGRTNDLARRESEHARDPALQDLDFQSVHSTDNPDERRGLEQLLHDEYHPPYNYNRPIDPNNPNLPKYMDAAQTHLDNIGK